MKYLLLVAMLGFSSASLAAEWPEFQNYRSTLDTLYRCHWVSVVQDDQQDQHSEDESNEDDEPDCD